MPNYYLFRCSNLTYPECIERNLAGQKMNMKGYVENVRAGDIIFLHKTGHDIPVSEQFIEGPFWAVTNGLHNIESEAWGGNFPMQVKFETKGKTSRIKQSSFEKFSLIYSLPGKFFDFNISSEVGRRLMEEMGFVTNFETKEIVDFNTLNDSDIDFRLRYPAKFRCKDGHYVRSIAETVIDNWLFNHYILHGYEMLINGERMLSDFYLKSKKGQEVFIEYWKLDDSDDYIRRKKEKEKLFLKNNLKLLKILSADRRLIVDYLEHQLLDF